MLKYLLIRTRGVIGSIQNLTRLKNLKFELDSNSIELFLRLLKLDSKNNYTRELLELDSKNNYTRELLELDSTKLKLIKN